MQFEVPPNEVNIAIVDTVSIHYVGTLADGKTASPAVVMFYYYES